MLEIGAIVWGVRDLHRSIKFWSEALNYKLVREPDVVVCVYVTAQKKGTLSLHEREWGIRSGPPLSTSSPRQ